MSSKSRERIVALDKRRVWHPYTEMGSYLDHVEPLVVERAEGVLLFDADGRSYLDGNASWWVSVLGHNHPRLVAALKRQAEVLCHAALAGITHESAAQLGEALCSVAPAGLEHVFFSDDGSTAVEVAMKMCLQYWAQNGRAQRRAFVALEGAFHGETLGVTALGGVDLFRAPFEGSLVRRFRAPFPGGGRSTESAVRCLAELFEREQDHVAALVLEPVVQGAAGMRIYDPAYLRAARELCHAHDLFLVADEVFTGYGRTGPMWACEHAGVSPDLLCTAKGLSGGMLPMGATLVTPRLFEGFLGSARRAFYYGHSFCGNPLGAAVGLEVLRVFEEERLLERAKSKAERIRRAFAALADLPGVKDVRCLGMVGALEFAGEAGYLGQAGWRVYEEALRRGAYLRPLGNVVYVTPSLTIPDGDLERLLTILDASVRTVVAGREAGPCPI